MWEIRFWTFSHVHDIFWSTANKLWSMYNQFLITNVTSFSFWQSMGSMNKKYKTGQKLKRSLCFSIFLSLFTWISFLIFFFFYSSLVCFRKQRRSYGGRIPEMSSMFWKGEILHFHFQNLGFKRNIVCWVRQEMLKADKRNNLKHYLVPVCIWTCALGFDFIFNIFS